MSESEPTTVTKREIVQRIAERTGQTKVVVRRVLQTFLEEIIDELARGNRLEFREFGVFEVKERAARRAQNPRTLQKVNVPARRVVKFKIGRTMRQRVCGDDDDEDDYLDEPLDDEPTEVAPPAAHGAPPAPEPPPPPRSPF